MSSSGKFKQSMTLRAKEIKLERRAKGLSVFDGGLGENPLPAPPSMVAAVGREAHRKGYTDTRGIPSLQKAITARLFNNDPAGEDAIERVVLGNGLKPLLYLAQLTFQKIFEDVVCRREFHLFFIWFGVIRAQRLDVGIHLRTCGKSYVAVDRCVSSLCCVRLFGVDWGL